MKSAGGRFIRLSLPRRIVSDILFAGKQLTLTTIERRMRLKPVVATRALAQPRPSWCAIFTKALAAVAARRPELRRGYVASPWPRLYEYDNTSAGIVVERDVHGESALFLARVRSPEKLSVLELDAVIRRYKDQPIEKVAGFRGALRFARLPQFMRRLFWRLVMNWMPSLRERLLGHLGVSVTAGHGAVGLFLIAPWTLCLHYGVIDANGELDVRITFDHRVIDGVGLAIALADLEEQLCGPILNELHTLRAAAA